MLDEASLAFPNSLLLVVGAHDADVPSAMPGVVAASPTCVAVGTRNEFDGDTTVSIQGGAPGERFPGGLRFVHRIERVEGRVQVVDVAWTPVVGVEWEGGSCWVIVDIDDPEEPTVIRLTVVDEWPC